jgi:hypothetical protein
MNAGGNKVIETDLNISAPYPEILLSNSSPFVFDISSILITAQL